MQEGTENDFFPLNSFETFTINFLSFQDHITSVQNLKKIHQDAPLEDKRGEYLAKGDQNIKFPLKL